MYRYVLPKDVDSLNTHPTCFLTHFFVISLDIPDDQYCVSKNNMMEPDTPDPRSDSET